MDRQEAIEFLMDHYDNPRNTGPLDHPDVSLSGGNPGCADVITMHARFDKDGKLDAVNWEGEGLHNQPRCRFLCYRNYAGENSGRGRTNELRGPHGGTWARVGYDTSDLCYSCPWHPKKGRT